MEEAGDRVRIVLGRRGVDQNNTIRSIRARYPATGEVVVQVSVPTPEEWDAGERQALCNFVDPVGNKLVVSYL